MSSLDYLELCRLCLVKENVNLPIFDDDVEAGQIHYKISATLPVKVEPDDKLPKKICQECGYKVELLYQFVNTSVSAEKQLLHWLGQVGGLEDKQGYVTEVLDSDVLKSEGSGDNRLDSTVMQVTEAGTIDMNMIDNMSIITMPDGSEQQFTTVPIDDSGTVQTVQVVAGPSTETTHDQITQSQVEEVEDEEEDNYDDGCDNDDSMAVKEETEEDQNERNLEPTFVNVTLPCDEAGPSGLQQKISNMSEITSQTADDDPKPGRKRSHRSNRTRTVVYQDSRDLVIDDEGNHYETVVPKSSIIPHSDRESNAEENNCFDESDFEEVSIDGRSDSFEPRLRSPPKKKKKPVYVCKHCEIYFTQRKMLENHMKSIHSAKSNKNIQKPKSSGRAALTDKLNDNSLGFRFVESIKSYKCNFCEYKCPKKGSIYLHVAIKHPNINKKSVEVRTPSITFTIESKPVKEKSPEFEETEEFEEKEEKEEIEEMEEMEEMQEGIEYIEDTKEEIEEVHLEYHDENSNNYEDSDPTKEEVQAMMEVEMMYENQQQQIQEAEIEAEEALENQENQEPVTVQAAGQDNNLEANPDADQDPFNDFHDNANDNDDDDEEETRVLKKQYGCPYCNFESNLRAGMNLHITREHAEAWKETMEQRLRLESQRGGVEDVNLAHACIYCDFTSSHRATLNAHTRRKHPGFIQPPPVRRRKEPPPEITCEECDFKTNDKRKMSLHVERKHCTEPKYGCEFCGKKFKTKVDLSSHIRFQHVRQPAVCDVCGKICHNSNALHVHQKREHYVPEFECHICHRRMVSQENLDEHIQRQHEQRNKYQCELCGKVFNQPSKLKQHLMTHTGERPHTCKLCHKSFARRAVYRQHLLIHTGKRPYECDICGKTFTQKPGLICHRKSHPGEKPPLPVVYIDRYLNDIQQPEEEEG